MLLRSKLLLGVMAFSFSTCTAELKHKIAAFRSETKPAHQPESEPPTEPTPPATGAAATAAGEPAINIHAGKSLIAPGTAYKTFLRRVPQENCPGGIDSRILYIDAQRAVIDRENCKDIEATTLRPETFTLARYDQNVLMYSGHLFDVETSTTEHATLLCSDGVDSAGRAIEVEVKQRTDSGGFNIYLAMRSSDGKVDSMAFAAKVRTTSKLTIYQAGESAKPPFFMISLGNFNGLAAFVSYEALFQGTGTLTRKETNMNLPHCYVP